MLHLNIIKLHLNINRLHVDIIYHACKGRSYATTFSGFFFVLFFIFITHVTGERLQILTHLYSVLMRIPQSLKWYSSTAESSAIGVMGIGDDPYKELPRVTVGVARYRTLSAQWPWVPYISQYLQLVTSPYEWKTFEWDVKPRTNIYFDNWFSTKIQFGVRVCLQYPESWLQYVAFNMYNVRYRCR